MSCGHGMNSLVSCQSLSAVMSVKLIHLLMFLVASGDRLLVGVAASKVNSSLSSLETSLYDQIAFNGTHSSYGKIAQVLGSVVGQNLENGNCSDTSSECPCLGELLYQPSDSILSQLQFQTLCPALLSWISLPACRAQQEGAEGDGHDEEGASHREQTAAEVWGYGFLFVTIINVCSLVGAGVIPLMKKSYYIYVMNFLIALAVGSLSASGILVLIPEAFEIVEHEEYVWKALTVLSGIYLFFLMERVMHLIRGPPASHPQGHSHHTPELEPPAKLSDIQLKNVDSVTSNGTTFTLSPSEGSSASILPSKETAEYPSKPVVKEEKQVQSVAWMIIVGDALHNFIDGLSIGASFTESIYLGISISIAVICEELPHELGDFAILLNAGMSKKRALLFNFLSATTCYLGLIIGISLGSMPGVTPWILALAGGMFLYIALADMLPEMTLASAQLKDEPWKVFFIQNGGLLLGFLIITLITLYGGEISL